MVVKVSLSAALGADLRNAPWHFVVTGASGWLGRATLAALGAVLGEQFALRVTALGSRAASLQLDDSLTLPVLPLLEWAPPAGAQLCVFHYAFLTMDKVAGMERSAYVAQNEAIRSQVLGWIDTAAVRAILVPSSGAVYDYLQSLDDPAKSVRSQSAALYGSLKYADEQAFRARCAQHGVRLVMPRVFNLAGPGINKYQAYALASFIDLLQQGSELVINARRPVLRSYYYIGDLLELCLRLLLRTDPPAFYGFDTVSDEVVELEELARRVSAVLGASKSPCRATLDPDAQADRYVGDRRAIAALEQTLGLRPVGLDAQIAATADHMHQHKQAQLAHARQTAVSPSSI